MALWVSWMLTAIYVAGWVVAARLLYGYWDDLGTDRDQDRLLAGFLAFFWPIGLVLAACWLIVRLPTLGCVTANDRRRRARDAAETAKWEREKLETRIAELERELGLANGNGKAHG